MYRRPFAPHEAKITPQDIALPSTIVATGTFEDLIAAIIDIKEYTSPPYESMITGTTGCPVFCATPILAAKSAAASSLKELTRMITGECLSSMSLISGDTFVVQCIFGSLCVESKMVSTNAHHNHTLSKGRFTKVYPQAPNPQAVQV